MPLFALCQNGGTLSLTLKTPEANRAEVYRSWSSNFPLELIMKLSMELRWRIPIELISELRG